MPARKLPAVSTISRNVADNAVNPLRLIMVLEKVTLTIVDQFE